MTTDTTPGTNPDPIPDTNPGTTRRESRRRPRPELGVVLPAYLLMVSMVLVALATAGFLLTTHPGGEEKASTVAKVRHPQPVPTATPERTRTPVPTMTSKPHHKKKPKPKPHPTPAVQRGHYYVEVYNNTNIHGLAGEIADRAQNAGWNVVGADNWYGTVATSTVYYPGGMYTEAVRLANDLGISRVRPAIDPMRMDRLTVILTGSVG